MPIYPGSGQAQLIRENRQIFLFQNETVAQGTASIAVQLERIRASYYPWGASFEVMFSGAPGTFELDIQTADIDEDPHYCTINVFNSTAQLNANYVGRIELPQFWAKYVRAYLKTLTNPVTTTLLVTR
jgi:hypothetical protein